jgi:type II secretory pathway component PulJ
MRGILQLISRDLRRAGYWQFDPAQQHANDNPFQQGENLVRSGAYPNEIAASCILLAYDLDQDGLIGVGQCNNGRCSSALDDDNVEQFGFRLRNKGVQSRYGGKSLSCASGFWQTLNDPDIEVTRLQFNLQQHCINLTNSEWPCGNSDSQLIQRAVRIDLAAHIRSQSDTSTSLTQWVSLRNDQLQASAP